LVLAWAVSLPGQTRQEYDAMSDSDEAPGGGPWFIAKENALAVYGKSEKGNYLLCFTKLDLATRFAEKLATASSETHNPMRAQTPTDLVKILQSAKQDGVAFVAMDAEFGATFALIPIERCIQDVRSRFLGA
jgi:hypothetical protein